ncbi:signal recognition particle protein [Erysipelotrichaceae bacterium OttesenSCG-928-M19]|nr:signal recognition particle protein [Erysipelotrichaceae bacterium OttesenSCG-928-M19]
MAFDNLSNRLQNTMKKIKGNNRLTQENMDEMFREIRLALLEADVNFKVVKEFIANIKEKAEGQDVINQLNPSQMVVKIVNDELVHLFGDSLEEIKFSKSPPTIIMMVGLQGAGKTTTAGKLANFLRDKYEKKPMMIAADIYRPAAIDQLKTVGEQLDIPVFEMGQIDPREIVTKGIAQAKENENDLVIIDTAGRLHLDEELMQELIDLKALVNPNEIMLVIDSLTGQDAINVAQSYHEQLEITGAILTKLDGDSRGGAALSIKHITGVPIKFIGTGEKLDAIDLFHPERMVSRMLGMGDVISLIEKASNVIDEEKAGKTADRMMSGKFDLEDMLEQMEQMNKLGSLGGLAKLIPGMPNISDEEEAKANERLKCTKAVIQSMTPKERRNPQLIKARRKERIARGCGMTNGDINKVLREYETMKKTMKQMGSMMGNKGSLKGMKDLQKMMGNRKF